MNRASLNVCLDSQYKGLQVKRKNKIMAHSLRKYNLVKKMGIQVLRRNYTWQRN